MYRAFRNHLDSVPKISLDNLWDVSKPSHIWQCRAKTKPLGGRNCPEKRQAYEAQICGRLQKHCRTDDAIVSFEQSGCFPEPIQTQLSGENGLCKGSDQEPSGHTGWGSENTCRDVRQLQKDSHQCCHPPVWDSWQTGWAGPRLWEIRFSGVRKPRFNCSASSLN